MGKLEGKIAVITGASTGIGLATAEDFVREGAYVYMTGRRQKELDAAVAIVGQNARAVQGDVSNLADLDRLYALIAEEKGRLDILFANAGIGDTIEPLGEITEDKFDLTFNVNLRGLLFTVQKALPLMHGGGAIVLCGSTNSTVVGLGQTAYSATKAGVRSFAHTWTQELRNRNIRVNVVAPGPTDTPIFKTTGYPEEMIREFIKTIVAKVPAGRMGRADEVAKAVTFLASEDSSFIRGVELFVDGGMVAL
jgi:NAD(P)-dependent dehydrogenase (short-subunit alcohol dehydrogenase family)